MSSAVSRAATIARHDLAMLKRDPFPLIVTIAMPLILASFLKGVFRTALVTEGYRTANGAEHAIPGMAVTFGLLLIALVGIQFFREHSWGTWDRLRSYCGPAEMLAGKLVVPLLTSALQLTALFTIGWLAFGLRIRGSVLALALVAAGFALCVTALGFIIVSFCTNVQQVTALGNMGAMLLAGLGGALAPIGTLPSWVETVARVTPSYWAMRGFATVLLDGGGIGDVLKPLAALVVLAVVLMGAAIRRYSPEERKASFTS